MDTNNIVNLKEVIPEDGIERSEPLKTCIENIVKNEGFLSFHIETTPAGKPGEDNSFLGDKYEINIKGETNKEKYKEVNLFIKKIIEFENIKEVVLISEAYKAELFLYTEYGKIIMELQKEANVPKEDCFRIPKSYDESNEKFIILDNLSKRGYKTCKSTDVVPIEFAELAFEQLGKFHALSFVLEEKKPKYFEENVKHRKQPVVFGESYNSLTENFQNIAKKGLDDFYKKKIEDFRPVFLKKYFEYISDATRTKCCVCHGDYRPSNIMVKEENGVITYIIPIDYQILYYSCPVHDLIYFIALSTDQQFRKQHLEHLKDVYHDSLGRYLRYFDMDVDSVYPRKQFEQDLNDRMDYMMMVAIHFLPIIFAAKDVTPDMVNDDDKYKLEPGLKERVEGIIDDLIEWNCL